jgi:hypothetical protein
MKALEIRARTTEEVGKHPEIPESVRRKFELKRLDEPSGASVDITVRKGDTAEKTRIDIPLRLGRVWHLGPVVEGLRRDLFTAFGLAEATTSVALTAEQAAIFAPVRRLMDAYIVEEALDGWIVEALATTVQGAATFNPGLLPRLLGVGSGTAHNVGELPDGLCKVLALIDERSELPFVEEFDGIDSLRESLRPTSWPLLTQEEGPEAVNSLMLELISARGRAPESFNLPDRVLRELVKKAQSEQAHAGRAPVGRPGGLGKEGPVLARLYAQFFRNLTADEKAQKIGVKRSRYYELLKEPLPPGPPDELARVLNESYGFPAADAFRFVQAIYKRKGRARR